MKIRYIIDLNPKSHRGLFNQTSILMKFEYCTFEAFGDWLEKNSTRLQAICQKWGWSYRVGYLDQFIEIVKEKG